MNILVSNDDVFVPAAAHVCQDRVLTIRAIDPFESPGIRIHRPQRGCCVIQAPQLDEVSLELLPGEGWVAVGATGFVALLPGFIFVSSEVNNDNALFLLTTLGTLLIVRIARGPYSTRH